MAKINQATPEQLQVVFDAVAKMFGAQHGLLDEEARAHISELKERVEAIEQVPHIQADDAVARQRGALEVDKLAESIARIHTASAKTGPKIKAAFRSVDLGKMADELRYIARWLREPTPEANTAVERFVTQLQSLTGVQPWDDRKTQEELAANIEADVKRSLEEIFGNNDDTMSGASELRPRTAGVE